MRQLSLFPTTIKSAKLKANSKKHAFYNIKIIENQGAYTVEKESGCSGKVMHKQAWAANSYDEAINFYNRKIKEKTSKSRKRVYMRVKK